MRAGLAAFAVILAATTAHAGELRGRVVAVADGDTLTILDASRQQHRIRLAEIDAPEKRQPFGQRSKQSLSDLCYGRDAAIEDGGRDRYGRTIGRVSCAGIEGSQQNSEKIVR
ncbi:thermonuclease family protein [Aeromonas caviae]|uniref:Thermonuclease family protein n=1 Tax=Aeromonas caviae TaxID=648 RepID=A0AA43ALB7_AERCA|nr:thermonuclease family protein [Aeromonas caviae]MDH1900617.1 thermonuclease family protein [Aeromonas caviae]